MTTYQQTESCFRNEKYQYEKTPEQKAQEVWLDRSARDNLDDRPI
jgi:hypothetical protein